MKNILSFVLVLLAFMSVVAQNSNEKNYNLPPGFIISSKRIIYDLSFKLDNTKPVVNYSQSDLKVLKDLTAEELENYKLQLGDYYKYCKEGIAYVDSLSDKVLSSLKKLKGHGKISEENIQDAIRDIRMALLEAGFSIETSWPVNTESEQSLHQARMNSNPASEGHRLRLSDYQFHRRRRVEVVGHGQ